MAVRRRRPVLAESVSPAMLAPGVPWRSVVASGADLGRLASMLRSCARVSCVGSGVLRPESVPELTGDAVADVDAVDEWLAAADADIDFTRYAGRRAWAWQMATNNEGRNQK